jgi:glycosidase
MPALKSVVAKWQKFMYDNDGWNALYLENHDQPRCVTRFASDLPEHRALSAKMLATFLGFQSGTVFVYQGQELGMANVPKHWTIQKYRDLETLNYWNESLQRIQINDPQTPSHELSLAEYRLKSRDNARTPVQWDASPNAGFSTAEPWISIHEDYETWNAAAQINDKGSTYHYWSNVLSLRKSRADIFVYGSFDMITAEHPDVFAYTRTASTGCAMIVTNFRTEEVSWTPPRQMNESLTSGKVVLSNYAFELPLETGKSVTLRPLEAFVWVGDAAASSNLSSGPLRN